jgi:hypothetical protein
MSRERLQVPFVPKNNHTVAVTLEEGVLAQVAAFAERIEIANRQRKRRNVQGLTAKGRESLALRIRGLSGEAALAVYLGLPPVRIADEWRHRPDVLCFDAITTDKPYGALIVTPRDRLDMMKVLIIDRSPVFHLCGWYRASDAREQAQRFHSEWWREEREHGGAWYVPQSFLRSLADEEAQKALARHYRQWTGTQYIDLEPIHKRQRGMYVLRPTGRIEWLPDTGEDKWNGLEVTGTAIDEINRSGVLIDHTHPAVRDLIDKVRRETDGRILDVQMYGETDLSKPPRTMDMVDEMENTDWREVLRRAGAAPPEPNPSPHED